MQTTSTSPVVERPRVHAPWEPIWRRRDVAIGVTALIVGFLLVGVFVIATADDESGDLVTVPGALATVGFEVWIGVSVLLLALWRGVSLRQLGYVRPERWGMIAVAVIGAYIAILGYFAMVLLVESFGVDLGWLREGNTIPDTTENDEVLLLAILGVAVVVIAPLSEELFFRGLLFRTFLGDGTGSGQRLLAIWISGLAFSAFHVNLSVLIPFTLVGALFAYVYRESRSLWTSTAAHAIFNGVNFAATVIDRL